MRQRSPGVLPGVWLGMVLAAVPAWAVEVPVVRFVEVGDAGVVFAGTAMRATVEVTTTLPFRGALTVTYRWTTSPAWTEGVSWGDRARLPLDLKPGNAALEVELPLPREGVGWGSPRQLLEFVWALEDAGGARLGSGRQPARLEPASALRILRLTAETSEGFRRAPRDAWSVPSRYEPYALVLVSREDLRTLSEDQRQALFDAAALGLTLVVTSPGGTGAFDPPGLPFDDVLANERVSWKGDGGEEIREAPLLWGRIRRTTLAPPASLQGLDDAALLSWMLLTAPPGRPELSRVFPPEEGRAWAKPQDRARAARLGSLSAYSVVALVLALLFASSKRHGRPSRLPVAAALAACLAAPPLLYGALASRRAGNADWKFRVTVHDGLGRVACIGRYESLGGGGGSDPVALDWKPSRRGIVAAGSLGAPRLTVSPSSGGVVQMRSANRGFTPDEVLNVFSRTLASPDPPWQADVRWQDGRLGGALTARRAVKDAWILGLGDGDGARLGAVPAGGRVDLGALSPVRGRAELERGLGPLRRAWMGRFGNWSLQVPPTFWPIPGLSPFVVVSEFEEEPDGTAAYDYLALHPEGAPDGVSVELPAIRSENDIHVTLPRALGSPTDVDLFLSREADSKPSRPARVEESPGGIRRVVLEGRARALEEWRPLRPDLPKGTGYVAARARKGT